MVGLTDLSQLAESQLTPELQRQLIGPLLAIWTSERSQLVNHSCSVVAGLAASCGSSLRTLVSVELLRGLLEGAGRSNKTMARCHSACLLQLVQRVPACAAAVTAAHKGLSDSLKRNTAAREAVARMMNVLLAVWPAAPWWERVDGAALHAVLLAGMTDSAAVTRCIGRINVRLLAALAPREVEALTAAHMRSHPRYFAQLRDEEDIAKDEACVAALGQEPVPVFIRLQYTDFRASGGPTSPAAASAVSPKAAATAAASGEAAEEDADHAEVQLEHDDYGDDADVPVVVSSSFASASSPLASVATAVAAAAAAQHAAARGSKAAAQPSPPQPPPVRATIPSALRAAGPSTPPSAAANRSAATAALTAAAAATAPAQAPVAALAPAAHAPAPPALPATVPAQYTASLQPGATATETLSSLASHSKRSMATALSASESVLSRLAAIDSRIAAANARALVAAAAAGPQAVLQVSAAAVRNAAGGAGGGSELVGRPEDSEGDAAGNAAEVLELAAAIRLYAHTISTALPALLAHADAAEAKAKAMQRR